VDEFRPAADDLTTVAALTDALSPEYLEHHGVLPLRVDNGRLLVATWREEVDVQALDDIHLLLGHAVELVQHPERIVRAAIRRVYGGEATARDVIAGIGPDSGSLDGDIPLDDLLDQASEALVVRLVNLLLLEALDVRASDVHLENYARTFRVRYRIDGVLQEAPSPPAHLSSAVISRLKIMAELDIAERRLPQDGRIRLHLQNRQVDVRVATIPTLHGESVVLRLLDKDGGRVGLGELGMDSDTLRLFAEAVSRPHGIVLSTGPTGSGKTTTLYAAVDHIRTGREKILTVEDPVEYQLEGVPQIPVKEKFGVTFATALRAVLRQDPDVLLVGEIRDQETAEIACHAALTGHLVLSTLHTNDAPAALTRLVDLGIPPYLIASTVEVVLAQRLVRIVCPLCAKPVAPAASILRALGETAASLPETAHGSGCEHCRGTGYRGRTGIYEFLVMTDLLRTELHRHLGAGELRQRAREGGMRTLREDGLRLIRAGVTTPEEVLRATSS
jgi:type II secretion system protein E